MGNISSADSMHKRRSMANGGHPLNAASRSNKKAASDSHKRNSKLSAREIGLGLGLGRGHGHGLGQVVPSDGMHSSKEHHPAGHPAVISDGVRIGMSLTSALGQASLFGHTDKRVAQPSDHKVQKADDDVTENEGLELQSPHLGRWGGLDGSIDVSIDDDGDFDGSHVRVATLNQFVDEMKD